MRRHQTSGEVEDVVLDWEALKDSYRFAEHTVSSVPFHSRKLYGALKPQEGTTHPVFGFSRNFLAVPVSVAAGLEFRNL